MRMSISLRNVVRHLVPKFSALLGAGLLLTVAVPLVNAQTTYTSADAAYAAGTRLLNEGNLAAAREPLEAALKLAPNDVVRLRVQRTLLVPYRELQEIEPLQGAAEYILRNSPQDAERSLTRRQLLTFVLLRGKLDTAIAGYEKRLEAAPDDRVLLYILVEAYAMYKKDPAKSVALAERLAAVEKKLGKPQDLRARAQQAQQLGAAGKHADSAALYEEIAPLDPKMAAWHYKEAAAAWLKAGDKQRALAAARKSDMSAPEARSEQLRFFWHKSLGDTYLAAGAAPEAVPHFEKALTLTKIDGYLKDTQRKLDEAKAGK